MVQVNRVYLKILFINRPQFLVDSNDCKYTTFTRSIQSIKTRHSTNGRNGNVVPFYLGVLFFAVFIYLCKFSNKKWTGRG